MSGIEKLILKHALRNAVRHGGKALPQIVLNKLLGERPELKKSIKDILPLIEKIVEKVNSMKLEDQKNLLNQISPEVAEKKVVEKKLPELPNTDKYKIIVTRFAPNPDFVLTLGNARPAILSYHYAKIYNGKFILRFEDTDPRTKSPKKIFYNLIREDLRWLGLKWDEEYIQSQRMEIYYEYARKLLEIGGGYVCIHSSKDIREMRRKGVRCSCSRDDVEKQLERWDKMLGGEYDEGEAVLRVFTDINHPDPSVRDWIAFRIIDTENYPHPLTGSKYIVWPTYNFACSIDDKLLKITHILRAKEHISNTIKQKYLYKHFGWNYPEAIHFGRLKLEGVILSKSKIRHGLERGEYESWDDPRLGTLQAFRRRGFYPETIWKIILDVGIKPSGALISLKNIYAINRKILEDKANRYMFVHKPHKILIKDDVKILNAHIPYHPSHPERGRREITLRKTEKGFEIYISENDFRELRIGSALRLMGLANIRITGIDDYGVAEIIDLPLSTARSKELPIIQWIPVNNNVKTIVIMPQKKKLIRIEGLAEKDILKLKPNTRIQFYRFGFVKIDKIIEDRVETIFIHD